MTDAVIRDLERALSSRPGDATTRLAFVRALVRARRIREALVALDLGKLRGPSFEEARALSDELWSHQIASLTCAFAMRFDGRAIAAKCMDPSGRFVAALTWSGSRAERLHWPGPPVRLEVADTVTDDRLDVALGAFGHGFPMLLAVEGSLFARADGIHRVALRPRLEVAERVAVDVELLSVSPRGDFIVTWHTTATPWERIHRWPGMEVVFERPKAPMDIGPKVLWEQRHVLFDTGADYVVLDFAGRLLRRLDCPRDDLGLSHHDDEPFAAQCMGELTLHELETARRVPIFPAGWLSDAPGVPRAFPRPRYSADRREVDVLLGGALRPIRVDPERGMATTPTEERRRFCAALTPADHVPLSWHPKACAAVTTLTENASLLTSRGELSRIDGARAQGWSADGHSLLVERPAQPGAYNPTALGTQLEVWRTRES